VQFSDSGWTLLYFDHDTGWTFDQDNDDPFNTFVQECDSDPGCTSTEAGEWTFVTLTREGDEWSIFANGVLLKSRTETRDLPGAEDVSIGYGDEYDLGGHYFDGLIDEVAIWDHALPIEEIGRHYCNGLEGKGYCVGGGDDSCVCVPETCVSLGKTCGDWPDGCGGTLNCGLPCAITCNDDSECNDFDPCTHNICIDPGLPSSVCDYSTPVPDLPPTSCSDDGDVCTLDICVVGVCDHPPIPNDCGARECGPSPSGCVASCGTCLPSESCISNMCVSSSGPLASIVSLTADSPVYSGDTVNIELVISKERVPKAVEIRDVLTNVFVADVLFGAIPRTTHNLSFDTAGLEGNFKVVASIDPPCGICEMSAIFSVVPVAEPVSIPEVSPLVVILVAFGVLAIAGLGKDN